MTFRKAGLAVTRIFRGTGEIGDLLMFTEALMRFFIVAGQAFMAGIQALRTPRGGLIGLMLLPLLACAAILSNALSRSRGDRRY